MFVVRPRENASWAGTARATPSGVVARIPVVVVVVAVAVVAVAVVAVAVVAVVVVAVVVVAE